MILIKFHLHLIFRILKYVSIFFSYVESTLIGNTIPFLNTITHFYLKRIDTLTWNWGEPELIKEKFLVTCVN